MPEDPLAARTDPHPEPPAAGGPPGALARSRTPLEVWSFLDGTASPLPDEVATEEPLEIRLEAGGEVRSVAVTLRTPGDGASDAELAAGFLYTEGVVADRARVAGFEPRRGATGAGSSIRVRLDGPAGDLAHLERHFVTTSACGACGKTSLDALLAGPRPPLPDPAGPPRFDPAVLAGLPAKLAAAQSVFRATGGLHAAALFTPGGELLALREDVGRHNALDKLVGAAFLAGELPWTERLVVVSGRAGYELVTKCAAAGAPALAAVSAPSSLAVATARRSGITLIGFLRDERFNVYSGVERVGGS